MGNLATIKDDVSISKIAPMQELIIKASKELAKSLPKHMRPERIIQMYLTCIRQNPELAQCTPESILGGLFTSAQLGLEFVAGNAFLLPFSNSRKVGIDAKGDPIFKKVREAQFIIGYRGLGNLFYRHEKSVQLAWGAVHEKDDFAYEYGTNAYLKHIPSQEKDRGKVKGFYVIATLQNGGRPFQYMSYEDCIEHGKKHSKTYIKKNNKETGQPYGFMASSPWITNTEAMCLKTVFIQLSKLLPLSIELQQAISIDETSREYKEGIKNAFEFRDTTNWEGETPALEEEAKEQKPAEEQKKENGGIELATLPQCQKIHILLDKLIKAEQITEADFYAQINKRFNINIDSTKSLTKSQASDVIEELQAQANKGAVEGKKETTEPKVKHICFDCYDNKKEAVEITEAEAGYSREHFGRKLCRACQEKAKTNK